MREVKGMFHSCRLTTKVGLDSSRSFCLEEDRERWRRGGNGKTKRRGIGEGIVNEGERGKVKLR